MKRVVIFLGIILGLAFGFGISAKAVSEKEFMSKEEYCRLEEAYVEEVRLILLEKGCKNAGVTLTYITDAEGTREYALTIHHRKLEEMKEQEWKLLQARMQETGEYFLGSNGSLMVKILSDIQGKIK